LSRLRELVASHDGTAALYNATATQLFGVLRILRRQDLVEEVLQENFVAVWDRAGDYSR
jgi:RNA polymerase sigma-70 factor (ECF subfamily)